MRKRFWEVFSKKGRTVNSVARYARKRLLLMRVVCAVLQRGAWSLRQVVDEVEGPPPSTSSTRVEVGIYLSRIQLIIVSAIRCFEEGYLAKLSRSNLWL